MPIELKTSISKLSPKKTNISALDIDALIKLLDKQKGGWANYSVTPTATPKFDKAKKVIEVTIKASPTATVPGWTQYSKTTKARQEEWDTMSPKAEKYVNALHALFLEAVAKFGEAIKDEDLDKAGWDKLWKAKKGDLTKPVDDYKSKTSNGKSVGLEMTDPGPDPVETVNNVPKPTEATFNVGGNSIGNVFKALKAHKWWGRYRSNQDKKLEYALDGNLKKITVKAAPVVTMPKWTEYSKRTKKQKDDWDNMWSILHDHEHHHHTIFTDGVDAMLKEIVDMKMKQSAAEKYWKDKMKAIQDEQDAFDTSTAHGANDGVELHLDADQP